MTKTLGQANAEAFDEETTRRRNAVIEAACAWSAAWTQYPSGQADVRTASNRLVDAVESWCEMKEAIDRQEPREAEDE